MSRTIQPWNLQGKYNHFRLEWTGCISVGAGIVIQTSILSDLAEDVMGE